MNNENTFILEVCKFFDPNKEKLIELIESPLDYQYILGQLLYNRIGGAAFLTLYDCELLSNLNREFRNTLKSIFQMNCIYSENFKSALNYIGEIMEPGEFPYALLKGAYLNGLYSEGVRTSNDIDILINQEDISKLTELLKNAGFKQGHVRNEKFTEATRQEILSSRMNRGETVPFIKEQLKGQRFVEIDINFSLDYKAVQETDAVAEILKRAERKISTRKNKLFTLEITDFLIHLCVHLYKEATTYKIFEMGRDLSLYKFLDIYYLIMKFHNGNLESGFAERAIELNLQKECYYAIYYTDKLFDINNDVLNTILNAIEPENKEYLKQIYDPVANKTYGYEMDFIDWIFCPDRPNQIAEIN